MTDETIQRKWQRTLAEYATARSEHQIACAVLSNRPQVFGETSTESLAEQSAREKLLSLSDQMSQLEADFRLGAPDTITD